MATIAPDDPLAATLVDVIRTGDLDRMRKLLAEDDELGAARIGFDSPAGKSRTLLHVVADWPGHFPNGAEMVKLLVDAGADPNARFHGSHTETPLHWAASSDDVPVLDALIDAGADIHARGSVIDTGMPLMNAVTFGQWNAARRLVERGSRSTLWQAAALGLDSQVDEWMRDDPPPGIDKINSAFWAACHGGQLAMAKRLHGLGADLNWLPEWEKCTPLDAARRSGAYDVLNWLHSQRARSAEQITA